MHLDHIYPPQDLPSSPHHISLPVLCLPFWSILIHWVMLVQSISTCVWGYLRRHGEPASSYIPEEKWVSFPKPATDSSTALGVTLWTLPSSMADVLTGLILCWSCVGDHRCHEFKTAAAGLFSEERLSQNSPFSSILSSLSSMCLRGVT